MNGNVNEIFMNHFFVKKLVFSELFSNYKLDPSVKVFFGGDRLCG